MNLRLAGYEPTALPLSYATLEPGTGFEPAYKNRFAVCRVAIPPPGHFWGVGTDLNCHLLGSQPRALPLCYLRHCLAEEEGVEPPRRC